MVAQHRREEPTDEGNSTYLDEVELDLLLGQSRPVVFLCFDLFENETQRFAGERSLDFLDVGKEIELQLVYRK